MRRLFSPEPGSGIPALLRAGVLAGGGSQTYSGSVVTFTAKRARAVKSLTAAISPVQDLHGQDAPYPAGGGKNIIPYPYSAASGTTIDGVTFNYQSDGKITASGTSGGVGLNFNLAQGFAFTAGTYTLSITGNHTGVRFFVYDRTNLAVVAVIESGSADASKTFTVDSDLDNVNIYFNRGATAGEVNISAYIQIEKGSSATPYTPYSNICPISGWDAVNVTRTGKNLYHYDDNNVSTCTMSNGVTRAVYRTGVRGGTYTFTASLVGDGATTSNVNISAYKGGIATIKNSFIAPGGITTRTFTFAEDEEVVFTTASEAPSSMSLNLPKYNIQIEPGSTATAYAAYSGQTYPLSLGRTVYGGSLDVTTGVLTVDRAMVDMGTLEWSKFSTADGTLFRSNIITGSNLAYTSTNFICSNYATVKPSNRTVGTISCSVANCVDVIDNSYSDVSSFQTAMDGVQLVYELATPQTYQLTPQEVVTLLGDNCIWADTGDIIVIV